MAADKKARSAPPQRATGEHYLPGDPIPAPDALEKNSDSIWDLWHRTHSAHEASFAETAPATVSAKDPADPRFAATEPAGLAQARPRAAAPRPLPAEPPTVDEAMLEARRNNRVCPLPERWLELFEMLPNRKPNRPTPPLVGPAWKATPSISKRMCLREHLEWAEASGNLAQVLDYLKQLPEEEWLHMGQ
jgi:hypothetical protein